MKTYHDTLMEDPEFRRGFVIEDLAGAASDLIARIMRDQNLTKADLARKLNKSRAFVTQLLSGKHNMTVRTLAEVLYHLDTEVKLHAQPLPWAPKKSVHVTTAKYTLDPTGLPNPEKFFSLKSEVLNNEDDKVRAEQPNPDQTTEYAA